jgi:hypothetical protein
MRITIIINTYYFKHTSESSQSSHATLECKVALANQTDDM